MENKIINNLSVNIYKPKKVKAGVIFTHGIAEYSKNYIDAANFFYEHDFLVITYDIRGHGKTVGKRGYVNSYNDLIDDLKMLVDLVKKSTNNVFLVGHSLGGVITNIYTSKYNDVSGIVISSSPTTYLKELKAFKYIPKFITNNIKIKTNFFDPNLVHENTYVMDEYDLSYFHIKYANEVLIKGMKELINNMKNISVPSLLIYSENDKLSNLSYGTNLYEKISSKDKELFILKESYHNIFNDLEKEIVFNKMLEFFNIRNNN